MNCLMLFLAFFRIGLFGFGGGMAMLPMIYQSIQQFGFMSSEEFSNLLALSQVTPGPVAINAATYVGLGYAGIPGAAAATAGVMLPAFIIMMIVGGMMERFKRSTLMQGAFYGIRPVTVGFIGAAAIFIGEGVLMNGPLISKELIGSGMAYFQPAAIAIMAATIVFMAAFKTKPIRIMILMAAVGALLGGMGVI